MIDIVYAGNDGQRSRFQRTVEVTYDALGNAVRNKIRTGIIRYENSLGQRLTSLWTTAEVDTHAATTRLSTTRVLKYDYGACAYKIISTAKPQ
jgi:hypothetical protein